jgi:hypothetical protein
LTTALRLYIFFTSKSGRNSEKIMAKRTQKPTIPSHSSGGYQKPIKSNIKIEISPGAERFFGGPEGAAFARSGHRHVDTIRAERETV